MRRLLIVLAAVALSYALGGLSVSRSTAKAEPEAVSSLLSMRQADASPLSHARDLLDGAPTAERDVEFQGAVLEMSASDLKALWQSHQRRFDFHDPDDVVLAKSILNRLASQDPEAAIALANGSYARYKLLPAVLCGWAAEDPKAAIEWIFIEADLPARHACFGAVLEQLGRVDRQEAFGLFRSALHDNVMSTSNWAGMGDFFLRWSQSEPRRALASALALRDYPDGKRATWSVLRGWGKQDPDSTAQWIASSAPKEMRTEAYEWLANSWAEVDSRKAADFIMTLKDTKAFDRSMWRVLGDWAGTDFDEAGAWLDHIEDVELRGQLQKKLLGWSDEYADREQGLNYALERLDQPMMLDVIMGRGERMAKDDAAEALAWGEAYLTDPDHLAKYKEKVVDGVIWWHPDKAPDYLNQLGDDHPELAMHHRDIASFWAEHHDPEAARAWVDTLPQGELRDSATLGLAKGWLGHDHKEAETWMSDLEVHSGPMREQLTAYHAEALMEVKSIEPSLAKAREISDANLREQTAENVLTTWISDRAKSVAARAYIEETDLISDATRWRLLNLRWGE